MITPHQAERLDHLLRGQGRPWTPAPGDRFVVPGRDLDDQVFVVSEMTIDVEDLPSGRLIRFNGTTEWALDSIPANDVLWMPWEHQLRDLLGDAFRSLLRTNDGWVVTLDDASEYAGHEPEQAYALALLDRVRQDTS
ncbi:pilus assembly protein CpaE [Nocardioides sp.]|uniref:pilus assembly protein CpaE n=1 Tax=Nocardioides sp. TaxID=35761 RepID=UPI002ED24F5D